MPTVHINRQLAKDIPGFQDLAYQLAYGLNETEIFAVEGTYDGYELHFENNSVYFKIEEYEYNSRDGLYTCNIVAIEGGMSSAPKAVRGESELFFHKYGMEFTKREEWGRSRQTLAKILIRDDIAMQDVSEEDVDPEDMKKFGAYGDDFKLASGEYRLVGRDWTRWHASRFQATAMQQVSDHFGVDMSSDDTEGEELWGSSSTNEQEGPVAAVTRQTSIVPDNISTIRVVALKYKGKVIAFRFKTDVGTWDMRKSVAAQYGLGEYKTETFMTLENVNGMLMSKTERERRKCVPDVSDCPVDCEKLMRFMFGD